MPWRNFLLVQNSELWNKVPCELGKHSYSGSTRVALAYNTLRDRLKEASVQKNRVRFRPDVSIEHRLLTGTWQYLRSVAREKDRAQLR